MHGWTVAVVNVHVTFSLSHVCYASIHILRDCTSRVVCFALHLCIDN